MRKYLLIAALLLAGCANMDRQDKFGVLVVSIVAGAALAASASSNNNEDGPAGVQCRTIIRPTPGGGIGTNVTIC